MLWLTITFPDPVSPSKIWGVTEMFGEGVLPPPKHFSGILGRNNKTENKSLITENVQSKDKWQKMLYMKDAKPERSFLGSQTSKPSP